MDFDTLILSTIYPTIVEDRRLCGYNYELRTCLDGRGLTKTP
jgi:hypothetical protein